MPCLRMLLRFFTSSHSNCMALPVFTIVHTMYGVRNHFAAPSAADSTGVHEMLQSLAQKQKRPTLSNRPFTLSNPESHICKLAIKPLRLRSDRRDRTLPSCPSPDLRASHPAPYPTRQPHTPTPRYRNTHPPAP